MCILIKHSPETNFNKDDIEDFYSFNPDGMGVMYGDGNKLHVTKSLGSVEEIWNIYNDICIGRECVIHFRMKTHGNIDLINCHPYHVTDKIWLAHNGILSASNPIRKEMSDTWHLIEYVIKPIAESNIGLLFDTCFQTYIGSLIGSTNKLCYAHADGRIAIINESSGVSYKNAWLSNTYAWSANKAGFGNASYFRGNYSVYNGFAVDEPYQYMNVKTKTNHEVRRSKQKIARAAINCFKRGRLEEWCEDNPKYAGFLISEYYESDGDDLEEIVNNPKICASWIGDIIEQDLLGSAHLM